MICTKCGSDVERDRRRRGKVPKDHDCKGVRARRAAAVTANVELARRRNLGNIKIVGQRGGHTLPGAAGGSQPESFIP